MDLECQILAQPAGRFKKSAPSAAETGVKNHEISAFHFFFFLPTIGPRMRNEQATLWGLCCFPMLEIQGDLYTFGGESESHNDPDKKRTIFKLTCDNRKCKWSQFFHWGRYGDERSHLVAIPVPDSFCT